MIKKLILLVILLITIIALGIQPVSGEEVSTYSVSGRLLFEEIPPPPGMFEVSWCEVFRGIGDDGEPWRICAFTNIPPTPRFTYNGLGEFEILDMEPGEYGLIFYFSHLFIILPNWPDDSYALFTIEDSDVDLGTLAYGECPPYVCLPSQRVYFPIVVVHSEKGTPNRTPTALEVEAVPEITIFQLGVKEIK